MLLRGACKHQECNHQRRGTHLPHESMTSVKCNKLLDPALHTPMILLHDRPVHSRQKRYQQQLSAQQRHLLRLIS